MYVWLSLCVTTASGLTNAVRVQKHLQIFIKDLWKYFKMMTLKPQMLKCSTLGRQILQLHIAYHHLDLNAHGQPPYYKRRRRTKVNWQSCDHHVLIWTSQSLAGVVRLSAYVSRLITVQCREKITPSLTYFYSSGQVFKLCGSREISLV